MVGKIKGKIVLRDIETLERLIFELKNKLCPSCEGYGGSWSQWDSRPDEWNVIYVEGLE